MSGMKILRPECSGGFTFLQIEKIMGSRIREFRDYMTGQTMMICQGEEGCGPHGPVVYSWDVERFLQGSPVID